MSEGKSQRIAKARVRIGHPAGLHARPAALFVQTAASFESTIQITNLTRDSERQADAKSIISLMTLGVEHDHEIEIDAEGSDADAAVEALRSLVEGDFNGEGG